MDFVLMPDDPAAAVNRLADPVVKIVSLTVTEKGYCLGVDFHLDPTNALVMAEMAPGSPPKSALGLVTAALIARHSAGVPPFTVMSCDNLPGNGGLTRRTLLEFAKAKGAAGDAEAAALATRIEAGGVAFPSTMVDRITPVTEAHHRALLEAEHKISDAVPVVCEEFKQWVVEDDFPNGRPPWEKVRP
jgi:mannitol 2-dehydrogenase